MPSDMDFLLDVGPTGFASALPMGKPLLQIENPTLPRR